MCSRFLRSSISYALRMAKWNNNDYEVNHDNVGNKEH